MEVTRPYERQHGSCKTSDQGHEQGKVGDYDGHGAGEQDQGQPETKAPPLELSGVVETWRETGAGFALEECRLQELHRCEIRQWVRKHGLADQDEIDNQLEAEIWQVVGHHFKSV